MRIETTFFRVIILTCTAFAMAKCNSLAVENKTAKKQTEKYQCLPCGQDCDNAQYNEAGECTHCHMKLVKKSTVNFKNIAPSEICDYIAEHPGVVLIDVRTKEEFDGKANPNFGSLKNAINLPIQELETRLSGIDSLKEKEIIVYCSHSHRSPRAAYMLGINGFKKVVNMSGGMSEMNDTSCKK